MTPEQLNASRTGTLCRIVKIGGTPDRRQPVAVHHKAQDAANAYQEWQQQPNDGTRIAMDVKNKHGEWRELELNDDDDTETIVRLIEDTAQSPY